MSRNLTISNDLYARLETEARNLGLKTVEELLARWQGFQTDVALRNEVVQQIDRLPERLLAQYWEMPDSAELLREDRAR